MTDDVTDAQIAAAWPERWQRANDPNLRNRSKARNQLRKAWAAHLEHEAFVSANPTAKCGNCEHLGRAHYPKPYCEIDSDFHGYQLVDLGDVCTRWDATLKGEPQ